MLTAIYTIIVFCLIIAIHEFGHFLAAKLSGVTVHEFSIGMGPRIYGFEKGGTNYTVRALPIGGFVKLEGEDEESDDPNAFGNKNPWQRFCILAAGAFMNFVLGFILFLIIWVLCTFAFWIIYHSLFEVAYFNLFNGCLKEIIVSGFFGAIVDAGIKAGDTIVRMEGKSFKTKVHNYNDIVYFTYKNGDNSADITFKREGKVFEKNITPKYTETEKRVLFGFSPKVLKPTVGRVIVSAYRQSVFVVKVVVSSFVDLIKGSVRVSDVSGPVGIVNEIGTAAKSGILDVMYLAALISINLGVVNLFPLPALDGGRILFVFIEIIRRKPVDRNKEGVIHLIGFLLLLVLMAVITYADIMKLL